MKLIVGDYHNLCVQSDTLFLPDVFENFKENVLKYINLILLTWTSMASLCKKTEVKLELLADINMLLMFEKGIRGGICHAVHR